MEKYFKSETFARYREANRVDDIVLRNRIAEEAIATTTGEEQVFWKTVQYENRLNQYRSPQEFREAWPSLEGILLLAPDNPETLRFALGRAYLLYGMTERYQRLPNLERLCRPIRHQLLHSYPTRSILAEMYIRKRRWHSAYRNCTLTLSSFQREPEPVRERLGGWLYYVYLKRALVLVILGRCQEAEADLAEAKAVAATRPPKWFSPDLLALVEAALAHSRGEHQEALAKLQGVLMPGPPKPGEVHYDVQHLLMAARIARAEGNNSGFEHFCSKAAALCEEHDLPISARAVKAVRNGAEY